MFDRFDKDSNYPLYRGPRLYARIEPLTKAELLVGRTHSSFWIRESSLLILKKSHMAALNIDDLKAIALSLDDSMFRGRNAAADLLGSHAEGRVFLTDALRAASDEKAVSAGIGILKHPDGFPKEIRTQALQRLLDCLGRCNLDALNYLNNAQQPEAIPWLKKTMFDDSLPENVTKQAADVFSHMATANDVPFLKQMIQSKRTNVRYAAIIRLRDFPSEDVIRVLLTQVDEPQEQVRHHVFVGLSDSKNLLALPALKKGLMDSHEDVVITAIDGIKKLRAKSALPDLVKIVAGNKSAQPELSRPQVMAGLAIADITGTKFDFGMGYMCHFSAMEAGAKVSAGKMLGGAKGKQLISEGEKELAKFKSTRDEHVAKVDAKNIEERVRLLNWWHTDGAKYQ